MEETLKHITECPDGVPCGFGLSKELIGCVPGGDGCGLAIFAEAELSPFHDNQLAAATQEIKNTLAKISTDADGRKLSLIWTNKGFLLTWVDHSGGVNTENCSITHASNPEDVARELKLKM